MVTCSPIYGLLVPEGSDAPCDIDDWSCDFAEAVESQLDALDAIVARTATTRPLFKVAATAPIAHNNFSGVLSNTIFDTVNADTDNMFSSATPDTITINTAGIYCFTAFVWGVETGPGGADIGSVDFLFRTIPSGGAVTSFWSDQRTFTASNQNFYLASSAMWPLGVGDQVFLANSSGTSPVGTMTINETQFSGVWLGDPS